jgi:hypothetical protein
MRRREKLRGRTRFMVVVRHEPDECIDAIEETIAQGPGFQTAYDWGCLVGDHIGFVAVMAGSRQEAIEDYVPYQWRSRAEAYRVAPFTVDELREMQDGQGDRETTWIESFLGTRR